MTFEEAIKKISKQDIEEVYIKQNNNKKETSNLLGISESMFARLIKYYDIHESKELVYESIRNTNKNKYGLDYARKRAEASKNTKLLKYGDANYNNKEKAKQTSLQKYGVSNPNKTKEVRDKIKNTCLNKYGATAAVNSDKYREYIKQIKLERYGSQNNHAKTIQTNLKKYGCEAPLQNKAIMSRKNQTCVEKYGSENVFAAKEIKEKIQQTMLKKYDVPYACMTKQCRNKAVKNDSSANLAFKDLLEKFNIQYTREFRLDNYSYDFKVNNYLIEIDPSATHNNLWAWRGHGIPHTHDYHLSKTNAALNYGYQCIHIFDWDDTNKIIMLLKKRCTVEASECEIKSIASAQANKFLDLYHIQGKCEADINLGLFYRNQLIELISITKILYKDESYYELSRFCNKEGYEVKNGISTLLSNFKQMYPNNILIVFCDKSKFSGLLYKDLGFILKEDLPPRKHWYYPYKHAYLSDEVLQQKGYNQIFNTNYSNEKSNDDLMISHGYVPVYDCGLQVWELKYA